MKNIILSSHGFQKNKELKKQLLLLLLKPTKELSAVIITTASVEWKEKNKHAVAAREALENMGFKKVDFLDVEFDNPEKLKDYDIIYINGGNPFYLLYHLKKNGADIIIKELSKKGAVIIGVSGGGVVLGSDINIVNYFDKKSNIIGLEDLSALGLTDIIIYPHYTQEIEGEVKKFESEFNCKVKRLTDEQSIIV